jgi:hypothetical protein
VIFRAIGGFNPNSPFNGFYADTNAKLADLVLVPLFLIVTTITLNRPRDAEDWGPARFLARMAWISPILGALVGLKEAMDFFTMADLFRPYFIVVAPVFAAVSVSVFLAFLTGAIAAVGARRPLGHRSIGRP